MEEAHWDIGRAKISLEKRAEEGKAKLDEWHSSKLKSYRAKRGLQNGRKRLKLRIGQGTPKTQCKKTQKSPSKRWAICINRHFSKEDQQVDGDAHPHWSSGKRKSEPHETSPPSSKNGHYQKD
jgi:hypothetical protein